MTVGRTSRREEGDFAGRSPRRSNVQALQERFDHTFQGSEIAAGNQCQVRRLHRQALAARGRYTLAISKRSASDCPCVSLCSRAASKLGSSSAEALTPASGSSDRPATVAAAIRMHGMARRSSTRLTSRLRRSLPRQGSGARQIRRARGPRGRARNGDRAVFGNMLVAVNPRHLFDQVDLTLQVAAPRWRAKADRLSVVRFFFEPQGFQDPHDFGSIDLDSQHARDLVQPQLDRRLLGLARRGRSSRDAACPRPLSRSAHRRACWPSR